MVPALVVLYLLLIGLAVGGSIVSFRLRQKHGLRFLRTYHVFVLFSFAYAAMNFVGEVFAPIVFPGPSESLARAYQVVDLITVPLLAGLFFLLFLWITELLGRPIPTALKSVFWGLEILFLGAFVVSFISYLARGLSIASYLGFYILNGIVLLVIVAAVLALVLVPPAGGDPARSRLARGLGTVYAASFAVLGAFLVLPRTLAVSDHTTSGVIPSALIFLVNLPALFYLRRSLRIRPPRLEPTSAEAQGLAVMSRAGITEREKEIIRLVALGLDNREIGKRLFISPKTVKNHMTSVFAKTGVRNRVQLANLLNRSGKDLGT